jgi:hypothetical protein
MYKTITINVWVGHTLYKDVISDNNLQK